MKNRIFYFAGLLTLLSLVLSDTTSFAQRRKKIKEKKISVYDIDTLKQPIPLQRRIFHDKIDAAQSTADVFDGIKDGRIRLDDEQYANTLTQAIIRDVDRLQIMIENLPFDEGDAFTSSNQKMRYLRDLADLLRKYNSDTKSDPLFWKRVVNNFREMLIAKHENRVMDYVINHPDIYTLTNAQLLEDHQEAKAYVYTHMARKDPKMMIKRLQEVANEPYADEIVSAAAKVVPNEIFNYATSTNYPLSNAVRRSTDPLVKTIVKIANESKSPLKAMPFLSDIYHNRKTIAEIDKITSDQDLFFKNLVRLKLQDEQLGGNTYTDELQYRGLKYVRDMNDLHDEKDAIRFKGIEGFSPEELYFIMVYGQDEIYTSSYTGTFKRMIARMGDSVKGDELLRKVHYDKFRTFIRMNAGYNTLADFLATMSPESKTKLMSDFIAGLEKGPEDQLEDAVDVADAFGSLKDTALLEYLRAEVKNNYERSYRERSLKGMRVYALLATLFNGLKASDNASAIKTQSEVLSLPPINLVQYERLKNDSGIIYQQFFFYGDEDGKTSFQNFLGNFKDGKWKRTDSKYWTTITSTSGKKIVIYANLPLSEPEDEEAQKQLCDYLAKSNIHPTIMVHRGHSYHLPLTMERFNKSSRIVMLGSCGGYHNLGKVLDASPDAHIISSKQTGAMNINDQIIKSMNARLLEGKDIEWISLWKDLDSYFTSKLPKYKSTFDDYVPPHKNLGAIFIKAYRKLSSNEEEEETES